MTRFCLVTRKATVVYRCSIERKQISVAKQNRGKHKNYQRKTKEQQEKPEVQEKQTPLHIETKFSITTANR